MSETLAILEKVHAFYSASFTQLIQYTTALLALVGVLVPSYLAFQQSRQTKREKAALSSEIQIQTDLARKALKDEIMADLEQSEKKLSLLIDTTTQDIQKQIKKMSYSVSGRTFHLQANSLLKDNNHAGSAFDSCEAGIAYAAAGEEGNLIRVLGLASESIQHLNRDAFEPEAMYALDKKVSEFIAALKEINQTRRFSDAIDQLNRLVTVAKKRQPPAAEA